jgi:hypothetical protein
MNMSWDDQLATINFLESSSVDDLKELSIVTTRQDLLITERTLVSWFNPTEYKNRDSWIYNHFEYDISELGFRGSDLPNNIGLAAYGCSFTFGQGLPITDIWYNHVSKHLNCNHYNFGQPAASIRSIAHIFSVTSCHTKIDTAIFLLPPYHRTLTAAKSKYSDDIDLVPIIPNYISNLERNFEVDSEQIYKALTDAELLTQFRDYLNLIIFVGKLKNIKIYFSSWDESTYRFMKKMNLGDMLLPEWTSTQELLGESARDGTHPGPKHHAYWASQIIPHIK